MTDVRLITSELGNELIDAMATADTIYLIVSFAADSGIRLLHKALAQAVARHAEIKILVGDYLYITEPDALQRLYQLQQGPPPVQPDPARPAESFQAREADFEIRLWQSQGRSFHPKAYLLQMEPDDGLLFVGSSNLSRSALTSGVEWNLAMRAQVAPLTFDRARQTFLESFYAACTLPVTPGVIDLYRADHDRYHREFPQTALQWRKDQAKVPASDDGDDGGHGPKPPVIKPPRPPVRPDAPPQGADSITVRPAQQEALDELQRTMADGYEKALVVMATGLGKTWLAALFARGFKRILFVAHREEILRQAQRAFARVLPDHTSGLYDGLHKETDATMVFASVFTLSMRRHLLAFDADHFDLIIVDEFHHAAARSYTNLLKHFAPRFLLGITATPERMDGNDIFGLCDGNVAYRINFLEAIERGWLSPFHYHGVYDDTDYDRVAWLGSHYDESDLYREQMASHMATRVLAVWKTLRGTRTLTFCSSIAQADWFAQTFRRAGVAAASLHSGPGAMDREQAIRAITDGTIEVLFTVDVFNEGVDIPSLDTLLFVRPTESLTVFIQQIGRGLRTSAGKSHCTIIDLIGNYRHADYKLRVFDMRPPSDHVTERWAQQIAVPAACEWDLDPRVVDLLRVMASKRSPRKERLREVWLTLQRDLGRSPSYLEFHLYGTVDSQAIRQEYTSWIQFREAMNDLTADERDRLKRYKGWLSEVESTRMSKSYKMVLLHCMLARGRETWPQRLTPRAAAQPFHAYLSAKPYRQADLDTAATGHSSAFMEKQISSLIRRMPMTMWAGSSSGWVTMTQEGFAILIDDSPQALSTLHDWTSQICEYRLHVYFERKQGGSGDSGGSGSSSVGVTPPMD